MDYEKYIKSEDWRRHRESAIEIADGIDDINKRVLPKNQSKVNVHHTSYANLGHESFGDTKVVSDKTHKIEHHKFKKNISMK